MKNVILFMLLISVAPGCASLKESIITGTAIGATSGGLLGNSLGTGDERHRNTNKGLLIGAAFGAGLSYLAYQEKKNKRSINQSEFLTESKNDTPLLTRPKVKRVWVEDKIQGKRFVRGHWEYLIEEQSQWSTK